MDFEEFDLDQVIIKINDEEFTVREICDGDYECDLDEDRVVVLVDENELEPQDARLYYGEDKQSDSFYDVIFNGETSYDVYPESITVNSDLV